MRKLEFLFIFLAVLVSVDYLTSVIGISWFEEQNQFVVAINAIIENWFLTFTLLYLVKLAALAGIYKVVELSKKVEVRRAAVAVSIVLIAAYSIIVVNNAVLIASAQESCSQSDVIDVTSVEQKFGSMTATYVYSSENQGGSGSFCPYASVYFKIKYNGAEINRIVFDTINHDYVDYIFQIRYYYIDDEDNYHFAWFVQSMGHVDVFNSENQDVGDGWLIYSEDRIEITLTYVDWSKVETGTYITLKFIPVGYGEWKHACGIGQEAELKINWIGVQNGAETRYNDGDWIDSNYNPKICDVMWGCYPILDSSWYSSVGNYISGVPDYVMLELKSSNKLSYSYVYTTYANFTATALDGKEYYFSIYDSSGLIYKNPVSSNNITFIYGNPLTEVVVNRSDDSYLTTIDLPQCQAQTNLNEVIFMFIDARTGALLDSVNFTLTGDDFSDSGIYDYKVTYTSDQLTQGNTYSYTASRDGYQPVSGSFTFQGGQVIKLHFVPSKEAFEDEMDDPVNNTVLTFTVLDSETKEPVEGATVTVESYSKLTNENGFTWFEVQKNGTYRYRVSKEGYYPISGTVNVGENQTDVTVELIPTSAIPTTTPAGGGDTGTGGSTGGGTGEDGGVDTTASAIDTLKANAQTLVSLCILVTIIALFNKAMPRRRR